MANIWDEILSGSASGGASPVAQSTAQGSGNVWDTVLSGIKPTDTSQPSPEKIAQGETPSQPQISGFEGVDFAKVPDKDLRNVQRDWIHPSDLDFNTVEVQEKINAGTREGDFVRLPATNIFDKYSGALVYLPEDPMRLANATAKFPDTQITSTEDANIVAPEIMDQGRFIDVTDEAGNTSKQFITNKDYYIKRLREGGTNPISAVFTAAGVGMEMIDDYKHKDFEDMSIPEQMLYNQKVIESKEREVQQKQTLAASGITGRETISSDYIEPEGFFGNAWEQLVSGFGYQMPRAVGGLAEMFGEKSGNRDLEEWGRDFGDRQLARFLAKPELLPPTDLEGFSEGGYKDPRWYGVAVGNLVPTITTTFGTMTLAGLASGGNPAVIGAAGSSVIFAQESSYAYNNMIDRGIAPQDAADAAMIYGAIAASLEGLSEIRVGKQLLSQQANAALKQSFKRRLLIELPKTIAIESGTEGLQQFTENIVTKWMDDEQKLMEGVIDSMAAGALGGTLFGGVNLVFDGGGFSSKADAPVTLQTFGIEEGSFESISSAELRDRVRFLDDDAIFDESAISDRRQLLDYEDSFSTPYLQTENVTVETVQYSDDSYSSRIVIQQDGQTYSIPFSGNYTTAQEAALGAIESAKSLNLDPAILDEINQFATPQDIDDAKNELLEQIRANRQLIRQQDERVRVARDKKIKGESPEFKYVPEDNRLADVNVVDALEKLSDKQFDRWIAIRIKDQYENDNQLIYEAVPAFTALIARGRYDDAAAVRGALPPRFTNGVTDQTLQQIKAFMDQQLSGRDLSGQTPLIETEPVDVKNVVSTPSGREKAATKPVESNQSQQKESRFFSRVKEDIGLEAEANPNYNPLNIEQDTRRSIDFVEDNFDMALKIAKGLENPPEGISQNSIAIAVLDKLRQQKRYDEEASVLKALSLRATRGGQEIVVLRGAFDLTSPEYYARQVLKGRMQKVGDLQVDYKGRKKKYTEVLDAETKKAKKKIDRKAADIKSAQDIINSIIC